MAQTYTLEEAAIRLGIPTDDFKRRLREEWKSVRSFRDGPTMRFRAADIDELARSLGQASEPELQFSEPKFDLGESSDEMLVITPPPPPSSGRLKSKPPAEEPLLLTDDTDDIFTVPSGDSSVSKKPKSSLAGDSDVRLDTTPAKPDADDLQTEEITLSLDPQASGVLKKKSSPKLNAPSSGKLSAPSSGKIKGPETNRIPGPKAAMPADDGSSEFELKLEDSDSFELELKPDDSDEVDLGGSIVEDGRGGQSGINLAKPKDSGVSLEKRDTSDDSDIEFDLSLDASDTDLPAMKSGGRVEATADSDSEFELRLEDSSGEMQPLVAEGDDEVAAGDIFETDFELPAVTGDESGSEVVALDSDTDLEDSDFEVAIDEGDAPLEDESASQVMLVEDEEAVEVDEDAALLVDEDGFGMADEEDDSISGALKGVHRGEPGEVEIRTVAAPPARWGVLPVLFLFPCFVAVILGGLMSFEMVRGMWGYQQPVKTSDSLVRGMAGQFDLKVND